MPYNLLSKALWNHLIASILSPLGSFLSLFVATDKIRFPKFFIWIFITFFGYCSIVLPSGSGDIVRYIEFFKRCTEQEMDFHELWFSQIYYDGGNIEGYSRILSWIVAQITSDYHIMTMLFASVFGFFYAQILYQILYAKTLAWRDRLLLLFMAMTQIGFWSWQTVDFYTAAVIFIYGAIMLYNNRNKRLLSTLIIASTPFFHASFLYITIGWFLLLLLRNIAQKIPLEILWALLFLSTLFIFFPPTALTGIVSMVMGGDNYYTRTYTFMNESSETGGIFYTSIIFFLRLFFLIWVAANQRKLGLFGKQTTYRLILLSIFAVNIFSGIPTARRIVSMFMVLLIVYIAMIKKREQPLKATPLHILTPIIFLYLTLTYAFHYTDMLSLITGPLFAPFIIGNGVPMGGLYEWFIQKG
ncbi:MAG: EpsG family protein [Porphyromonas endodontalis]|uniref:EpsG family protein n=1 Tax=Porphyromonas endodontalis TaxID=28124 RepID=UPI003606991C